MEDSPMSAVRVGAVALLLSLPLSRLLAQDVKERVTLQGHLAPVLTVGWSADGKTLYSGDGAPTTAGTVRVWDVASGKERPPLPPHTVSVFAVAPSPDGKLLATTDWA